MQLDNNFIRTRSDLRKALDDFTTNPTRETEKALRLQRLLYVSKLMTSDSEAILQMIASGLDTTDRNLIDSPIRYLALDNTERELVNSLASSGQPDLRSPREILRFRILRCYCLAFQWSYRLDLDRTPAWLHKECIAYALEVPLLLRGAGDADKYVAHLLAAFQYVAAYVQSEGCVPEYLEYVLRGLNTLGCSFSGSNLREVMRIRGELIDMCLRRRGATVDYRFPERSGGEQRLRIGFLVRTLGDRNESHITVAHVRQLNRGRYETFLYSQMPVHDEFSQVMRAQFEHFHCLGELSLPEQAELIRRDDLDVLLITNCEYAECLKETYLTAHRLARLQVCTTAIWPLTSGLRTVDYMLSSRSTEPADAQQHYTEKLILEGDHFICFTNPCVREPQRGGGRFTLLDGISRDALVFSSGAAHVKLSTEVLQAWAEILAQTPGSELVLYPFGPNWYQGKQAQQYAFASRIQDIFATAGVGSERIHILPRLRPDEVAAVMRRTDVYLDSFPYAGTTSLIDAIRQKRPAIALDGNSQRAIQGAYVLRASGLGVLVAETVEAYVEKAVQLAKDREWRDVCSRMVTEYPPYFDDGLYAHRLDGILQGLLPSLCF